MTEGAHSGVMPRQGPWARLLAMLVVVGLTLAGLAPAAPPMAQAPLAQGLSQGLAQALSVICSASQRSEAEVRADAVPAAPRPVRHPASQIQCGLCPACPGAFADTGPAPDVAVLWSPVAGPVIAVDLGISFPPHQPPGAERPPVRGPPV